MCTRNSTCLLKGSEIAFCHMDVTIHEELKNRVSIANISSCRVLKFESGTCFPYLNVCTCFVNACKMELVFPYLNADNIENCVCYIISTHLRVR